MKKLLTLILACAMITGLFAAGVAAEDKIKVGYDIYFLGNSWSVQLYQEFKWNIENNYADKIDVTYVESEGDISKQIANLEDLIAQEVDVIITTPNDTTALNATGRPLLLVDAGANTDCQPKWIVQFAMMGSAYMRRVMNVEKPEVGLLNIGVEAAKGNEQARNTYALMEKPQPFAFIGNVEARDALAGKADVIAADGFVGNVLLKNTEGVISLIFGLIKGGLMDSAKGKLAALLAKDTFRNIKRSFDSTEIGGAPLLGVEGAVIKAHGNSNARAIFCAIRQAKNMVEGGVVDVIRDEVAKLTVETEE